MVLGQTFTILQNANEYSILETEKNLWMNKATLLEQTRPAPCCNCLQPDPFEGSALMFKFKHLDI